MKKYSLLIVTALFVFAAAIPAYASLAESVKTTTEGAVEFPLGIVKLVGGIIWTVGEVIALPFTAIF